MSMPATIGHNRAPSALDFAPETMATLSAWMAEHPVIETEDDAREAKKLLDRVKGCTGDIEAERDKLVRPLNAEITEINTTYKAVHNTDSKKPGRLDKVANELKARLSAFIQAEEERREREANEKALAAEEAERASLEAAMREREAIDNAKAGELGVDVTQVVVEADAKAAAAQKAQREAARADRETHVKIGGGWQKAVSLRSKETLVLVDQAKALAAIGPNDKITEAILSAAREYRTQKGTLPEGVSSEITRAL